MLSATQVVHDHGGFATYRDVVAATSRVALEHAVRAGEVVRQGRGRYSLAWVDDAAATAHGMGGLLSHTSAALWHGWEVLRVPDRPHVLVKAKRRLRPEVAGLVHVHRGDVLPEDVRGGVCTSPELTLVHCLRTLPGDEALAVADSALRHGVTPGTLRRVALSARGAGAGRVRRVAARADERAANPFESALRQVALGVPGLHVEPQRVVIGTRQTVRPDLVDLDLGLVLEADSFAWHGGRKALAGDARRYNLLVVDGWLVLRFAWEDVMSDQDYVRDVLVGIVALAQRRGGARRCPTCAA